MDISYVPPLDTSKIPEGKAARWNGTEWEFYDHNPKPIVPTAEELAQQTLYFCEGKRKYLLSDSDFVFLSDSKVDPSTLPLWEAYRQALRDLPKTDINWGTDKVVFPTAPEYKKI